MRGQKEVMALKVVKLAEFNSILASHKLVAVMFTATWCGPCKSIGPIFEGFVWKYPTIKFIKVDVDENSETAENYEISSMPTFKFFANGQESVEELVGADEMELDGKLQALATA